jgi:hypothetical protein
MPLENYVKASAQTCFLLLAALALLFPVIWPEVKLALLGCLVIAVLLLEAMGRHSSVCLHRRTLVFFASLLSLNGFFVLWGMWNGAPAEGSREAVNVYLLFPVAYLFLVSVTPSIINPTTVTRVLLLVSLIVAFLTIAQSVRVFSLGILPGYSLLYYIYPGLEQDYMNVGFTGVDGYLPRATERLAFLGPFAVALLAVGKRAGLSSRLVWVNFFLVLLAVILTGRRVFMLILVLAILALLVSQVMAARKEVFRGVIAAGVVGLLALGIYQVLQQSTLETASRVEAISSNVATDLGNLTFGIRQEQIRHVLAEADRNPILGKGFGSKLPGHVRDPQHPWRFELTYVALLFQTGALGIGLYAVIALQLLALAKDAWDVDRYAIMPYVVGMTGGLMAAATNPYLNYGSGQWLLFLPVVLFNGVLVQSGMKQAQAIAQSRLQQGSSGVHVP